jgi:small-conductance mechanosensitive channel
VLNAIHIEIKEAFDAAGIEIPFPHRSLYAGAATAPLPVRVVPDATD